MQVDGKVFVNLQQGECLGSMDVREVEESADGCDRDVHGAGDDAIMIARSKGGRENLGNRRVGRR